ncbi:MAG: hypothetical protein ACT4TC_16975, partial [Myxococcaceae bacterium]
ARTSIRPKFHALGLVLLMVLPGLAEAAPKRRAQGRRAQPELVVASFTGPSAKKVHLALKQAVCRNVNCVRDRPGSDAPVLLGKVQKQGGKWVAQLTIVDGDGEKVMRKQLALSKAFKPAREALSSTSRLVARTLSGEEPESDTPLREEEEEETPKRGNGSKSGPVLEEEEDSAVASSSKKRGRAIEADQGEAEEVEPSTSKRSRVAASSDPSEGSVGGVEQTFSRERRLNEEHALFALEAGAYVFSRRLQYQQRASAELVSFPGGASFAPQLRGELYPFIRKGGILGGIGLEGSFARTLGQKVTLTDGRQFSAIVQNWDAALAWRFQPITGQQFAIVPKMGVRNQQFAVSGDSAGLPGTNYVSVQGGVGLDVPIGQRFRLYGEAAYLGVLSAGQFTSSTYFPRAKSMGVLARAGLGVRVTQAFEIVASGGYETYRHTLSSDPADLFVAGTASDSYISGNVGLRLNL